MIVLDEFDGANHYEPLPTEKQMIQTYGINKIWYYMYFKRSFVSRKDGRFMSYPHKQRSDMYPLTYPLAEAYVQPQFNMVRSIEIMCTLRGNKEMSTRQRAQDWVAGMYVYVHLYML